MKKIKDQILSATSVEKQKELLSKLIYNMRLNFAIILFSIAALSVIVYKILYNFGRI
jgi:hypothetical protein